MKASLRRLFRIFYNSFFLLLLIVILAVLLITPSDAIQQALKNKQSYNVFVIAGCYFLTTVFSALIWTTRWWTNKQALKAIPKTYVPVESGDVTKKVRKMIVASLSRSATIAWDARPRIETEQTAPGLNNRDGLGTPKEDEESRESSKRKSDIEKDGQATASPLRKPVWGTISHEGWSSPTSEDLPNLQFITVILELPHLIEARAVSLAPEEPQSDTVPPLPDMRAVGLLQRPSSMGLRDYVGHLTAVGVISNSEMAMDFLVDYEYARFSDRPLTETQFRDLMKLFAEILREMKPLSASVMEEMYMQDDESFIDGDATSATTSYRSRSIASLRSTASLGTVQTAPSRRVTRTPTRNNEFIADPLTPTTPRSRRRIASNSAHPHQLSERRPYARSAASSQCSLRSLSQGSVIRLSPTNERHDLPYTISMPP